MKFFLITIIFLSVFVMGEAYAVDVTIIEVESDPSGQNEGNQWIRIFNPFGSSVDLSGWEINSIHMGTSSYILSETIPACDDITIFFPFHFDDTQNGYLALKDSLGNFVDVTIVWEVKADDERTFQTAETPACISTQREEATSLFESFPGRIHGNVSTVNASPILGDPLDTITIIQFAEFPCRVCKLLLSDSFPFERDYIGPGKVNVIFFDAPLLSVVSPIASQAAYCAEDQGMYWEFHNSLLHFGKSSEELKMRASSLGLDMDLFESCLDSGKYTQRVLYNMFDAIKLGIRWDSQLPVYIFVGPNDQQEFLQYGISLEGIILDILPADKINSQTLGTVSVAGMGGTLAVKLYHDEIVPGQLTTLKTDFINPHTSQIQKHIDWTLTISKDGQALFGPTPVSHSTEGSLQNLKYTFEEEGIYNLEFGIEGILFQPIPLERVSYNVVVGDFDLPESVSTSQEVIENIPIIPKTVPETPELEEETEEKVVEEISGIFEEVAKIVYC